MRKLKAFLLLLPVALLAGCGGAEKQKAVVQPPVPPPAVSHEEQAIAPKPPVPKPPPPKPDPVATLISHAEASYAEGMREYQAGNMDNARQNFDKALSVLLQSGLDLSSDARLNAEFYRLVEKIHSVEVATLDRGDGLSDQKTEQTPFESLTGLTFPVDPNVKQRVQLELQAVQSEMPLVSNDLVDGVLTYFQGRGAGFINKVLTRVGVYQPLISETLRKEGVPQELIYLAAGESGYNPLARSRKGATGIWQFMLATGSHYGLRRDRWVDERKDPVKSTQAAARHLKDLYQKFGDWYLAMAAYDSGPLTIQRAIERTGYADFWTLRKLHALPTETENYVPIFVATALIAKDPKSYGFDVQPAPALAVDPVVVGTPTDLRLVAEIINCSVNDLIQLNPSLLRWATPPNDPDFVLYLPAGTADAYQQGIAAIPKDKRLWWRVHTLEHGETLSAIASKYHISLASLREVNQISKEDPVTSGTRLILPLAEGSEYALGRLYRGGPRRLLHYRIRRGDTLIVIADRFDVTVHDLRRWNNLRSSRIIAGKTLRIYVPVGRSGGSRSRTTRSSSTAKHTSSRSTGSKSAVKSGSRGTTQASR